MGELPPTTGSPSLSGTVNSPTRDGLQSLTTAAPSPTPRGPGSKSSLTSPLSQEQAHLVQDVSRIHGSQSGSYRASAPHAQHQEPASLDMSSIAGALPNTSIDLGQSNLQTQHQERPILGASPPGVLYQLQNQHLRGSPTGPLPAHATYNHGYGHGQYPANFVPAQGLQYGALTSINTGQQRQNPSNPIHHPYQTFQQPAPYVYYPPYGHPAPFPQAFPAHNPQPQLIFTRRPSLPSGQGPMVTQSFDMPLHDGAYPLNRTFPNSMPMDTNSTVALAGVQSGAQVLNRPAQSGVFSSMPRGPPRKPKQSGHALWVGNLPPGTTVVDLKDHFSRDATKDIESLFLISKSNCAFVNYRTEASCTAAMHRFHDSRFQGVRLVCRLRRSSAPASGVPLGPSAMFRRPSASTSPPQSPTPVDTTNEPLQEVQEDGAGSNSEEAPKKSEANAKYFVLKSLTLQDLELSVRNGIWTTQSHNEEILNKAFQTVPNVYLIFSANKSGEYFGYARMLSPIQDDAQLVIDPAPHNPTYLDSVDVPKSIPTPATEFAPKGRIIDDSARGTIFWEAELSDSDTEEGERENERVDSHGQGQAELDGSPVAQSWGKPFKIEWISTNRVPFYRTRGLRNPWNANREVKIARDGTELETSVGARLIHMFHRLGPSDVGATIMPFHPMQGGQQPPAY